MKATKLCAAGILALFLSIIQIPTVVSAQVVTDTAKLNYVASNIYGTWINVTFPSTSNTDYDFIIPASSVSTMLATVLTAQSANKDLLLQLPTGYGEWTQLVGVFSK